MDKLDGEYAETENIRFGTLPRILPVLDNLRGEIDLLGDEVRLSRALNHRLRQRLETAKLPKGELENTKF